MGNRSDRYFATASKDEIGEAIVERLRRESDDGGMRAKRAQMFATAYQHYYGYEMGRGITSAVMRGGSDGELTELRNNKARAIATSLRSLVLGPQVTWRAQAANNSTGARSATILGNSILEWEYKSGGVNRIHALQVEAAIRDAEAFTVSLWDKNAGPEIGAHSGRVYRAGDIRRLNVPAWDVWVDQDAPDYYQTRWRCVRIYENKWDVIADHPTDIMGKPTRDAVLSLGRDQMMSTLTPWQAQATRDSDLIPVWYFFHDPSPSLPLGLEVKFVSSQCVLTRTSLTYPMTPVVRLASDELFGTPFGYSNWWDTLSLQEIMDALETVIASNQMAFGVQAIAVEEGTESPPDNARGLKEFKYRKGGKPPTALNLVSTPREIFDHLARKSSDQMQLLNLNDTFRGQPGTAQMNAQAFVVLVTQAIQQNSPFQRAAFDALAKLGTLTLRLYAQRVKQPRKVQIAGRSTASLNLYAERQYVGKDLGPVEQVFCDIGNPLEQTVAGRQTIIKDMQASGFIKTPEQYQQVLDTGRLEPATESIRNQLMLISHEADELREGKPVMAHFLDDHLLHGKENGAVIADPEVRKNPKALQAVWDHLNQHYVEYFHLPDGVDPTTDPDYPIRMRILLGQVPPPPPGPPGGVPPGPPPPGADAGGPPPPMSEGFGADPGGPPEGIPEPPPNPITGAPMNAANAPPSSAAPI